MRKSMIWFAVMVGALLVSAAPAAAAMRPITFETRLGDGTLYGAASDASTVTLRWKDAAGHIKAGGEVVASSWGSWSFSAPDGVVLEPGDRLTASDGLSTHRLAVPYLKAVANRVKNVFKGSAPPGSRLSIECFWPGQPVPDIACQRIQLRVNEQGHWWHYPGWNIEGGDGAELRWRSPEGDAVYFSVEAPYVVVTIGTSQVTGNGRQHSNAVVSLKDSGGHLIGSSLSQIGFRQAFTGTFRDGSGNRVRVEPGQRLAANVAADANFIVPEIHATGDTDTETVSGYCEDTGRSAHEVWIRVYRAGVRRGFAITETAADGSFAQVMTDVWFPDASVIKHGDRLLISCLQKNRDFVQQWFAVP